MPKNKKKRWEYTLNVTHEDHMSGVWGYMTSNDWCEVLSEAHKVLSEHPRWSCEVEIRDPAHWYDK